MAIEKSETSLFLTKWHEGNEEGLNALLERHLPWIREHVHRRLGPLLRKKGETCDYVQEAMVQFLQYGPRFTLSDDARFRALILKIVENTLRNQHDRYAARRREAARERPLPPDTVLSLDPPEGKVNTPSQSVERRENEAWIRLGLEFLDPEDRELLILRQWDKLSYPEIGKRLGITDTAARLRHRRVVGRLGEKVWALRSGKLDRLVE